MEEQTTPAKKTRAPPVEWTCKSCGFKATSKDMRKGGKMVFKMMDKPYDKMNCFCIECVEAGKFK